MAQRVIEVQATFEFQSMYAKDAYIENPICVAPIRIHDYNILYNKPILNGKTLEGDMSLADIGLLFATYDETMEVLGGRRSSEVLETSERLAGIKFLTYDQYVSMKKDPSVIDIIYYIVNYKVDSKKETYAALCIGDGVKAIGDLPLTIGETKEEEEIIKQVLDKVGVKVDETNKEMLVFYK